MNEWWWWLVVWGSCLLLGLALLAANQGIGAGLVLLAGALFIFGLPFAAFMDLATPCDGYDLEYVSDGWGDKPVCIDDDGVRFEP
jgi:hypothetical protein